MDEFHPFVGGVLPCAQGVIEFFSAGAGRQQVGVFVSPKTPTYPRAPSLALCAIHLAPKATRKAPLRSSLDGVFPSINPMVNMGSIRVLGLEFHPLPLLARRALSFIQDKRRGLSEGMQ